MGSESIVNALLEPTRLMVAGSLVGSVRTAAQVAERIGMDPRDVVKAINELDRIAFVEQSGNGFTVSSHSWRRLISELAAPGSLDK